jgi:hypothetical protein
MGIMDDWDDYLDEPWAAEENLSGSVTGLRMVLSDAYSGASDAQIEDALAEVMDAMSPAEAFDFGAALNQIARGASHALSDPTVASIARAVLPLAAGAAGTFIAGPVGTALGSQLGTIAANALPPARGSGAARAVPVPRGAVPSAGPAVPAVTLPAVPGGGPEPGAPTSPAAGGSAAAAQGLVLAGNPLVRQALAAAALGQHGQQQVAGVPVAQLLGLLSQVVGRAAEDADELRYVSTAPAVTRPEAGESSEGDADGSGETGQSLYTTLVDAENLDLAEAFDLRGWEP